MTERLYYTDCYSRHFTGQALEAISGAGGFSVVLDRSLFYPTSGGQPHDTGQLGNARVVDVSVREQDRAVLHLLDAPVEPGPLEGHIDWTRRYDHMQQHTGQHLLSQAFERVAGAATIGFHLGADRVSIDLGIPVLAESAITDAEALANEVVSANAPVRAWFPDAEELRALALRKQAEVAGPVRIVAIGDFDVSACGGTHLAATGEAGLIAVLRTERLKRGVRVEFLCGGRARGDYARKHAILRELSAALTCAPNELHESVTRLQENLQETRRELAVHAERELEDEALRRIETAARNGPVRVVRAAWADRPIDQVKGLALRVTGATGVVALFGVAGTRTQLLFGRSEDLALDLRPSFDRALADLGGGRGGGARLLQGAAGPADLAAVEAALHTAEAALLQGAR